MAILPRLISPVRPEHNVGSNDPICCVVIEDVPITRRKGNPKMAASRHGAPGRVREKLIK